MNAFYEIDFAKDEVERESKVVELNIQTAFAISYLIEEFEVEEMSIKKTDKFPTHYFVGKIDINNINSLYDNLWYGDKMEKIPVSDN